MADTLVTNLAADVEGKTLLLAETAAQQVTGDLIPVNAAQVGWMQRSVTTLTDAQIKTLPSTPITLVAAPASGYRVKVLAPVSMIIRSTGGNYSGLNTTYAALSISYTGNTGPWLAAPIVNDSTTNPNLTRLTDFFGSTALTVDLPVPGTEAYQFDSAPGADIQWVVDYGANGLSSQVDGKPLVLALDNDGSVTDLGTGNAANTLKVIVYYTIEAL